MSFDANTRGRDTFFERGLFKRAVVKRFYSEMKIELLPTEVDRNVCIETSEQQTIWNFYLASGGRNCNITIPEYLLRVLNSDDETPQFFQFVQKLAIKLVNSMAVGALDGDGLPGAGI